MKTYISAIIPTYNSIKTLVPCIDSLYKQSHKIDDIIVVDNGSSDDTYDIVKKKFPKVKLFRNKTNSGVTGGRNSGIRKSSKQSTHLLFVDHDMIADKSMVGELLRVIEPDSSIGITTPKIYYLGNKKRIWSAGTGINLWTGQTIFRGGIDKGQYEKTQEVEVAPATFLVKAEVIAKLKKFDNRYFATYEDSDFCFRARAKGFKTFYVPKALAYHDLSEDSEKEAERLMDRSYLVARNRILFLRDFGKPTWILFVPVYFVYYTKMAIKYHKLPKMIDYLRGLKDGFVGK